MKTYIDLKALKQDWKQQSDKAKLCQYRNWCGLVAQDFNDYLNKKGIKAKLVSGKVKVDIPQTAIQDFTSKEKLEMKRLNLNPYISKDRIKFASKKGLTEKLKRIPHKWNEMSINGKRIVLDVADAQFKRYMKNNLSKGRYMK